MFEKGDIMETIRYVVVWSNLANFIGEMVAKYAEAMDLDNLSDPDF